MIKKIFIFDDDQKDLEELEKQMKSVGCEVKTFRTHDSKEIFKQQDVLKFNPDLAIVDSLFKSELDGMGIVKGLTRTFPGISIVICTKFVNDATKRVWIKEQYKDVKGVCAVIGKKPLPTGQEILDLCKKTE